MHESCEGLSINLAAAALASALAEGQTAAQIELLSAFFDVLGDSLNTLAVTKARQELCNSQ